VDFKDFAVLAENWGKWIQEIQDPPYENLDLNVNDTQTFQKIDGFGASLTDSSAWLIYKFLNASERQVVLTDLFDPNEGIGLSYLRQPMGSSDLRLAEYSYDDLPSGQTDYNMAHFSIAYDANYIIPTLLEIRAINPDVKIMGSPWSPPAWMKTSGSRLYGSLINDDKVYRALANYFVRFIQGYAAYGIDVNAITLQNEPYYEPYSYPGMRMEPADQIRLVKFMGPAFEANSIDTKILIWDHNWDNTSFAITVYNDSVARSYIDGSAWHHYGGDVSAQTTVHDARPEKNIYFTEGSDGTWNDGGFSADLIRNGTFVVDVIRNWAKTVIKWNLALDQNNGPKISGGCGTCYGVITINQSTRQVSRRPHYYALGHASKFLRPGAVRIGANDNIGGLRTVVFKNTDGSIVSYVVNPSSVSHNLKINWNGQWFIYTIPAQSIVTFRWDNTASAIVQVMITSGDGSKLLEQQIPVMLHN
jgi:glucosylceramidase